jgi:long-chain acyl-CoA synthetase
MQPGSTAYTRIFASGLQAMPWLVSCSQDLHFSAGAHYPRIALQTAQSAPYIAFKGREFCRAGRLLPFNDAAWEAGMSDAQKAILNGSSANTARFQWSSIYPPDIRWDMPFTNITLPGMLEHTAARLGSKPATHFLGKVHTYKELAGEVDRAAKGLQALGVKKGVQVGLLLPNCPAFVVLYYAVLKTGGTVVNFNPLYTVEELTFQTRDSGTRIMVTLDLAATFPKADALLQAGELDRIIVCPFRHMLPVHKGLLFHAFKRKQVASWHNSPAKDRIVPYRTLTANDGNPAPVTVDMEDVAVLQYTGGTTGTPKGAILTHRNISANVQQVQAWFPATWEGCERFLCVIPFFHVFAMTGMMNYAIAIGAQMIMLPRFELEAALKTIDAVKPTIMAGVPTIYNALMNAPQIKKYNVSSLKHCISGGAPLPLEVKHGFESATGCTLVEGYGLSETSPVATINPLRGPVKDRSIGLPVPGTVISLRKLGEPEVEVAQGERGEVCIAGPQVMKGYWQRPQETADAFVGEFFRTGDVGVMDTDGFTYIVDRIKDMILCSGYNVYPRRVEDAIYEHPAVQEVTVIGIPDNYRGEAPKAYIKLRDGQEATAKDILDFLVPKLSKIEMPSEIEFRDELPKTMIGKLSKKELRAGK